MNHTRIEDLPLLEENSQYSAFPPDEHHMPNLDGKIRNFKDSSMPRESGMSRYAQFNMTESSEPRQYVQQPAYRELTCREVSDHIRECPICTSFYHKDTSLHLVFIVLLSLVCVLLLKRVLNV